MIEISYGQMVLAISVIWLLVRGVCALRAGRVDVKRELQLLLVYICIVVVVRFTFCPFGTVDGKIQPLVFDGDRIFPLWLNLRPFVFLFDYPTLREALLNLIGNIAMFIPLGIVWPAVFTKLDRPWKVIGAGVGVSLAIEILQLPFFGRSTDIDDLILNSVGYVLGYVLWLLARRIKTRVSHQ